MFVKTGVESFESVVSFEEFRRKHVLFYEMALGCTNKATIRDVALSSVMFTQSSGMCGLTFFFVYFMLYMDWGSLLWTEGLK